ncbi:MAG: FHA domain-containing protein [Bacteroidaceae bacterium]|nr:FHA domain-containing protein [Bacteroidaceae bacterium]
MKRIHCPKCDESILFDNEQYTPGRTLVFECPACRKQFRLRIKPAASSETNEAEEPERQAYAAVIVIENAFHLKQEIPLYEGDNVIGRHVPGTNANAAFKTVDPSVDTTHCIINVALRGGSPTLTLRDAPSNTGTFIGDHLLRLKERVTLQDGDVITIGATSLIVKAED